MTADGEPAAGASPLVTTGFLRLVGSNAEIKGPLTRAGQDGWIAIQAWSHAVVSPRDAASGLASGRHHPVVVTKPIDATSPRLMEALLEEEALAEWVLEILPPESTGPGAPSPAAADFLHLASRDQAVREYLAAQEKLRRQTNVALRVELAGARLARIETMMLDNTDPAHLLQPPRERLLFNYQQIFWTWGAGARTLRAENPAPPAPGSGPVTVAEPPPATPPRPTGVHIELNIAKNTAEAEVTVKGDRGTLLPNVEVTGYFRSANTGQTGVPASGRTDTVGKVTLSPESFSMPAGADRWFEFRLAQPDLLGSKWTRVGRFVTKTVEFPP